MLEAIFNDAITTVTVSGLTQWDYGRILYVKGLELPDKFEIHFSDILNPVAIVMQGKKQNSDFICEVPNVLLESAHDIYGYIYLDDGKQGKTVREIILRVKKRPKPNDYVSENNASEVIDQVAKAKGYADDVKAQVDRVDAILENVPDFGAYEKLAELNETIKTKLDKNQGVENVGKALLVDESGNVTPQPLPESGLSEDDVNALITNKGYQTESQVNEIIKGKNYVDKDTLNTTLDDYATNQDLNDLRYTGLYVNAPYSGIASNKGIKLHSVQGKSIQATTKGYQLFDASKLPTQSMYGVTMTNHGDGTFSFTGSNTSQYEFSFSYLYTHEESVNLLKVGTLICQRFENFKLFAFMSYYLNDTYKGEVNSDDMNNLNITQEMLNDPTFKIKIGFYLTKDATASSVTIKPMLYQDGTGEYEPFTGGKPSPNPEYEQEIKNVEVKTLNSSNTNLVLGNLKAYINGINYIDEDGNSELFYWKTVKGKQYTFGADVSFNKKIVGYCDNKPAEGVTVYDRETLNENSFIAKHSAYFCIYASNTLNDELKKSFRANIGNELLPYDEHEGAETPTNLTLRSLPNDVRDSYENGIITRRLGIVTFDGSSDENWSLQGATGELFNYFPHNMKPNFDNYATTGTMCNRFKEYTPNELWAGETMKHGFCLASNSIRFKHSEINNLGEWKSWLQSHPITVQYELATPTTEKVNVPTVQSFYPYTNVWTDNEVDTKMSFELLANSDNSLDINAILERLSALEKRALERQ